MFLITLLSNFIYFVLLEYLCTKVYGRRTFKHLYLGLLILIIIKSLSILTQNQYINLVISIFAYYCVFLIHNKKSRNSISLSIFWLIIFYGTTMFVEVFSILAMKLLIGTDFESVSRSPHMFIIANCISIVSEIVIVYVITVLYNIKFYRTQSRIYLLLMMLPVSLVFIVLSIDPVIKLSSSKNIILLLAILCFMAAIICTVYVLNYMLKQEQINHKFELEKANQQIDNLYYQQIKDRMQELQSQKHDIVKHLNTISHFIQHSDNDIALSYINGLTEQYNQTRIIYTGNNLLDTILTTYSSDINSLNINTNFHVTKVNFSWISPIDMTCIIGNVLDNAIYSCKHSKTKYIHFFLDVKNDYVIIKVTNSCDMVRRKNGKFQSIKRVGAKSYGLYNITRCSEKYSGSTLFKYDEIKKEFSSTIFIPIIDKEVQS